MAKTAYATKAPEGLAKPGTLAKNKVKLSQLRWKCPISKFNFKSTAALEPLGAIVGQPRAMEAIRLGSELFATGYNVFVTGISGTGRLTTVKRILQGVTTHDPELFDFCYVHNFNKNDQPRLLRLQRGKGRLFASEINDAINFLRRRLPKLFEEDTYQKNKRRIVEDYQERERTSLHTFDEKIKPYGFVRGSFETEEGVSQPEVFPVIDDKPVHIDAIDELIAEGKVSKAAGDKIKAMYRKFHIEIYNLFRKGMKLMKEFRKELSEHDKASAKIIVESVFDEILEHFPYSKMSEYIEEVKDYILGHLNLFVLQSNSIPQLAELEEQQINSEKFDLFAVNVILDNTATESAPVIIERYPTYANLFGTKERVYDSRGFWRTDFTKIKSGSMLQADQGYLIVNADDLFSEPGVWTSLKRVLLYGKLEIQPSDTFFQVSQSHLKPEPIDVAVKVIIIGGQTLYNMLYNYEKGFKKIFKINAQFDYETAKTEEMMNNYARFIAKVCTQEKLPHFKPDGVAAIIEWAVEHAGSQNKITLKFSDVADLIRESVFYADAGNNGFIRRQDVLKAINWRRKRHDLIDSKMKEMIIEGNMLIDTDGERVGQINGLTVMSDGILSFGKPARITANVSAGSGGIINIEREVNMSGRIHSKGVLIITGFFRERFAMNKPLSMTASITFEQSYGGIDGDSASAAEINVLISAITGIPIKQSIAITGSVNQKGDIQPIGGVNEKIRGFFDVCKARGLADCKDMPGGQGLTGCQGVIIPRQNVNDLMLCREITDAVKDKKFHIFAISRIEDSIEILMNVKAGKLQADGTYPAGTVMRKVVDRLEHLHKSAKRSKTSRKRSGK